MYFFQSAIQFYSYVARLCKLRKSLYVHFINCCKSKAINMLLTLKITNWEQSYLLKRLMICLLFKISQEKIVRLLLFLICASKGFFPPFVSAHHFQKLQDPLCGYNTQANAIKQSLKYLEISSFVVVYYYVMRGT